PSRNGRIGSINKGAIMQIKIDRVGDQFLGSDLKILTAFQKICSKDQMSASITHWSDKGLKEEFENLRSLKNFKAAMDETIAFTGAMGETVWVVGLGEKNKAKAEDLRKSVAKVLKSAKSGKFETIAFD